MADDIIWLSTEIVQVNNGNRTEWSPIRSVIILVISGIGRPRSGNPISFITSRMITDRIVRRVIDILL